MLCSRSSLLLLLITVLFFRATVQAECLINPTIMIISRSGSRVSLQCVLLSGSPGDVSFCQNESSEVNSLNQATYVFDISKETEADYRCCCGSCMSDTCSSSVTILANQEPDNNVPLQHNFKWGEEVTIRCPYTPGNYLDSYSFDWSVTLTTGLLLNDIHKQDFVQFDKANNSITIPNFNPLFEGKYTCELTANGNSIDTTIGPNTNARYINVTMESNTAISAASITSLSSDISVPDGGEARFVCQASIKQSEVLGFRINGSLDRLAKDRTGCTENRNTATLSCDEKVEGTAQQSHKLSCDFSESYTVSCNFTITDLSEANSTEVECFLTDGQSDVDKKSAGLFVIPKSFPTPSLTIDPQNKNFTLDITLKYPVTVSDINVRVNLTGNNESFSDVIPAEVIGTDRLTVRAVVKVPNLSYNNSRVSYEICFGGGQYHSGGQSAILELNPPPVTVVTSSTLSSTVLPTTTSLSTGASTSTSSISLSSPTVQPTRGPIVSNSSTIVVITGVSVASVVVIVLIIVVIIVLILMTRKGKTSTKDGYSPAASSIAENGGSPPATGCHYLQLSPLHNNNIDGSQVSTIDTYIGDHSPHLASSTHSSRSSASHSSNSCPSTQHLRQKPLPRYGIPDHQQYQPNIPYQQHMHVPVTLSFPGNLPGINVINPTPTMENQPSLGEYPDGIVSPTETEPFASPANTPSAERDQVISSLPNRPRDLHIPTNPVESPGTTPLSDQTMIGVLLYLQHTDCDKKDTCQTCKLIERHFTRIAKKYGDGALTGMMKNIGTPGAENTLKHLRKREKKTKNLRSPHRQQPPPPVAPFKRQRSMSASHLDEEELTFSSTETEDDSAISKRRYNKGRHRTAVTDDERGNVEYSRLQLRQINEEMSLSQNDLPRTPLGVGGLPGYDHNEYQKKNSSISVGSESTDSSTTSRPDSNPPFYNGMSVSYMRAQLSTDAEESQPTELMQPRNSNSLKFEKMVSNTSNSTSSGYDTDSALFRPPTNRFISSGSSEQESIQESPQHNNSQHHNHRHHGNHHDNHSHHGKDHHSHHHQHHQSKGKHHHNSHTSSDYSLDTGYAIGSSRKISVPTYTLSPSNSGVISTHSSPDRYRFGSQPSIGSNQSNKSIHSESALPYTKTTHKQQYYSPPHSRLNANRTPSPIKFTLPSDESSATPL